MIQYCGENWRGLDGKPRHSRIFLIASGGLKSAVCRRSRSDGMSSTGRLLRPNQEGSKDFDVVIHEGGRGSPPEFNIWNEISETSDLKYVALPEELLERMAKEFELERKNIPIGLLRGIDRRIATVARSGTVVYGRDDMPDDFAYAVAKALDEHQELLQWRFLRD